MLLKKKNSWENRANREKLHLVKRGALASLTHLAFFHTRPDLSLEDCTFSTNHHRKKKTNFFVVYAFVVTLNLISESSPTANDRKELCTVLSEKDAC